LGFVPDLDQQTEESTVGFDNLSLSPVMLGALAKVEYLTPTPVQAGLIPRALAGVDVLGQARTGTGKTAAFVIPILERLDEHPRGPGHKVSGPRALVLVPTRELAVQVRDEAVKLSHGRRLHIVPLYGGKPLRGQIEKLQRGVDIAIGTPGRVLDHMGRGTLDLRDLKFIVLDEADRMLDIGFRPDIERILRKCPASRQTLLLSATMPPPVERLAQRYMRDPEMLNFSPKDISVDTIEQFYFTVDPERKYELLERLLMREEPRQAIIFCRTKRGTDKVNHRLEKKLKGVACIHGDLAQNVRDRVMAGFREGKIRYLVATDVVGRGIDVTGISHIINYDVPAFCDDYVHRVGRTGRMGREGVAYTFVTPEEGNELTRIEMRIDRLLTRDELPGFVGVVERQHNGDLPRMGAQAAPDGAASVADAAETAGAKPRSAAPLLGRGGRAPRRNRRAL
jgi:ATP-dependent RNA helicase DeaD